MDYTVRQTDWGQVIIGRGQARVVAQTPNRARTVAWANQARILQVRASMKEEDEYEAGRDLCRHRRSQGSAGCSHTPEGDIWSVDYDEQAVSELVSSLLAVEPTMVLLEATGGLEVPLVSALAAAALPVVVVNPRQVRDFAKATGKLAKTDALDAQVLAHFAEAVRPPVRPLRDEDTQELNSLTTRRNQLMTMLVAEKNRLRRASHSVHPSIQSHIRWLEQELNDLDKDLRETLRSSPVWQEALQEAPQEAPLTQSTAA